MFCNTWAGDEVGVLSAMVKGKYPSNSRSRNMSDLTPKDESGQKRLPAAGNDVTFDDVLADLEDVSDDGHYNLAHRALKDLMQKLDLTEAEQVGLEGPIGGLEAMLQKMEASVIHIAVFGMVGRGKSSLLNALIGRKVFEAGALHGVTRSYQVAQWEVSRESFGDPEHPILRAALPGMAKSQIQLIDTPGIDEVGGEARELLAKEVAEQSDLLLFVVSGDITKVEYQALAQLREVGKPMVLVFNKVDQYPESDRDSIYEKICSDRVKQLLSRDEVVMAAASPLVPNATRGADGRISVKMEPGLPMVDELKLKILEILHREGKSLVALNSMLYADDVNEQLVKRKMEIREQEANQVIWNGVMAKAIAVAINPITVLDIVSSAAVDVAMILAMSKLYGIEMTQRGAIDLLKSVGVAMGGITAGELLADLGLSSLKGLLGLASGATGGMALVAYAPVAIMQGAVAGVSSYGIGQVIKVYLSNGASWGEHGPKSVVSEILQSLDQDSILRRIKGELRSKIDLPRFRGRTKDQGS
jgi:GTPase